MNLTLTPLEAVKRTDEARKRIEEEISQKREKERARIQECATVLYPEIQKIIESAILNGNYRARIDIANLATNKGFNEEDAEDITDIIVKDLKKEGWSVSQDLYDPSIIITWG